MKYQISPDMTLSILGRVLKKIWTKTFKRKQDLSVTLGKRKRHFIWFMYVAMSHDKSCDSLK